MKKMLRVTMVAVSLIAGFATACESRVASLQVEPEALLIRSSDVHPVLSATVLDRNNESVWDTPPDWSSSDPSVVEVDGAGVLTPRRSGTAVVSASLDNLVSNVTITVAFCTDIQTEGLTTHVAVGERKALNILTLDEAGKPIECPLTWIIGDSNIATIDQDGMVTGISRGITSVTVGTGRLQSDLSVVVTPSPEAPVGSAELVSTDDGAPSL